MTPIESAIELAIRCHRDQFRKNGNLPYIVHPIAVMGRIQSWGISDHKALQAAILHDVLEDCDDVPRDGIDDDVWSVVEELTFDPSKSEKNEYLCSFKDKSASAIAIKIADRICNTRDFWLAGDKGYAIKYWRKAHAVTSLAWIREVELCEAFSHKVQLNIAEDVGNHSTLFNV